VPNGAHNDSTSVTGSSTASVPVNQLRLYIARSTPNSIRAEHNLSVVVNSLNSGGRAPQIEIIDVFANPKRALTDGVVVTPTLVCISGTKRIMLMGDLADQAHLLQTIESHGS
jgi:circadian clock protein KaiB